MEAMTTEDQTYNGWKNYPTWAVNLWLSNDEGLYHHVYEMVANLQGANETKPERYLVADAIKNFVTDDLAPDLGASFAADLMGWALDSVDWYEIADAWLEQ